MHTARSRNDEVATCIRIVLREELLGLMAEVNGLAEALIERAGEHKETVITGSPTSSTPSRRPSPTTSSPTPTLFCGTSIGCGTLTTG